MPLQLFVEDRLSEVYEVLVRKALDIPSRDRRQVRASRVDLDDLTQRDSLLELVQLSQRSNYNCVIFIMDEEAWPQSADRPAKLQAFSLAFRELCDYLAALPKRHALKSIKVTRIVCQRCLESWLASDPQAIVEAVSSKRGVNFEPTPQNTENLTPAQASEYIAHLIRQVGQRLGRRDLQQIRASNVKSRGQTIAERVDPVRASPYNRSLKYFYELIPCTQSGCEQPFPDQD